FLDENGKPLSEATLASIGGNADWKEFATEQAVPENARYLRLTAGLERAAGVLEVDDITLTPAAEIPLGNAELAANVRLNWGQEPVTPISATRGQISLNGLWRFLPAVGPTTIQLSTQDSGLSTAPGWGYIRVPGNWKNNGDIVARGQGRIWQNFNGDRVNQVWYERTIKIPAEWDGRAMLLDFQRVSTDAEVFVNGQSAGQIRWPGGTVDITAHVKAGQDANLRLRVIAVDDRSQVEVYMGYLQTEMKPASLDNKGIIGDVNLLSRPAGGYVYDVLMRPSTRQKKLNVDIELGGVAQAGNVELTARMLDEKGQVEQTFTKTLPVQATAMQKVTASWDWSNPRLWEVGQPNKYTMQLNVKSAGINDQYVQEFGFRDFWIEGRKFFLNNSEFRLRPGVVQYGVKPSQRLEQGHNFAEIWPERNTRRGSRNNDDELIADAEKVGMPISGNTIFMADFLGKGWETPEVKADYRRQMEMLVRRWRNKPSILMWGTSGNALGNSIGDSDPWTIGLPEVNDVQEQLVRRERAKEAISMHKEVDPTRPIFGHHSDNGDFVTSNMYLNFIPLQEREEWLSHWATQGRVPWMAVEFGPPLYASLMRGRDGYTHQGHSEPFLSEWTAVYLGKEAYQLEPANYRTEVIRDRYKGGNVQHEYDPHIRNNGRDRIVSESPSYTILLDLFYTNTWRSWRTMGVSGGMVPWHHDTHPALKRVNGPSLAWIANMGGIPDQSNQDALVFTAKDHSFRAGQAIAKQIVLINDHRASQDYSAQWEVTVNGKRVAGETKSGGLKTGELLFLPLNLAAPSTLTGDKAEGRITLSAKIGPDTHQDTFAFHVFAPVPPAKGTLTVFDPVGETSAMLKSLGYVIRPWQGSAPPATVLVIGRKVLSQKHQIPGNLEAFVRNGGRAIVFGQDANWTKYALGLRTAPYLARRVFRIDANHPVVQGLDDYDLQDWNGVSKLVEAYPHYPGYQWLHAYGWHWGNRGAVSSTPIEKPHRTSWRPILETEFDLAYTPLMEMEYGRGRLTFCTLDLEDHVTQDPAARKLARQLMEYMRTAPITPKAQKVLYIGDDNGAKMLDMLGVVYAKATAIDPNAGLIIVGANPGVGDGDLHTYATNGGKLLFLQRATAGALGTQLEQAKEFIGSLKVPVWPEARGLSASDLRWRSVGEAWLLKADNNIEVGADGQLGRQPIGKGVAIFAQLGPDSV
ncbi:MAG: beta-galactosidase, partial [Armatimonadota bacterium]|nr:beta-galactosidase [Armatimonadota bacterium]